MNWYPIDGVSFVVRSNVLQETLEVGDITYSSRQQNVSWPLINISAQHQYGETDVGLCQGLDWREVMRWYIVGRATFTARVTAQQEPRSINAPSWWHWDPGGSTSSRLSQRWTWDPVTEGSSHVSIAWRRDEDRCFVWDPGIGS